jgi:hypothetical protein
VRRPTFFFANTSSGAPVCWRPITLTGPFFGIGQKLPSSGDSASTGLRGVVPWFGDFNPFDCELEPIISLQPSSATPMPPAQLLRSLAGAGSERVPGNPNLSSDSSARTLAALSPSIPIQISMDFSTSLNMIENPQVGNHILPGALREPENTTIKPKSLESKHVSTSGTITCEFPGCTIKFSRKKDRNRHFRIKHQSNGGYRCPFVHCSMGTGHRIQRRDKLREHLRRKGDESTPLQCILPGCFTIARDRAALLDHLGQHNRVVRLSQQQLLIDYNLITGDLHPGSYYDKPPLGYLTCAFICEILGCPFGTNSHDDMITHSSIPHEGPHCPCPMPDCEQIFRDWSTTSAHLARSHDANDRKAHDKELLSQGFWWRNSVFICPICKFKIKILLNKVSCDEKIRDHCRAHSVDLLKLNEKELVSAFARSNRRTLWYPRMPLLDPASDEQVFAYLIWPKEKLLEVWNMGELV